MRRALDLRRANHPSTSASPNQLSARATLNLTKLLPEELAGLPMAQTIWYIPTGLDIWNQKILKAPGHYARAPGWTPPA